jgi:hypothetical protein
MFPSPNPSTRLERHKLSAQSKPYQTGDIPDFISVGNGGLYVTSDAKMTTWEGYPYQETPPEGWVALNEGSGSLRVLRTSNADIIACGHPQLRWDELTFLLYAPADQVFPVPEESTYTVATALSTSIPTPQEGITFNHARSNYTISLSESWDHATWFKLGRCEYQEGEWCGTVAQQRGVNQPILVTAASTHALADCGLTDICVGLRCTELHISSAVLADPEKAADFFGVDWLVHLPHGTKLGKSGISYFRKTSVALPGELIPKISWLKDEAPTLTCYMRDTQVQGIELTKDFMLTDPFVVAHGNVLLANRTASAEEFGKDFVRIGTLSRQIGKVVGDMPFSDWARQAVAEHLYTVTYLTAEDELKETTQTWVPKDKVETIKKAASHAGDWRRQIEETSGIRLPDSANLTREQAEAYIAYQSVKAHKGLVQFSEVKEFFRQTWELQVTEVMGFMMSNEPITFDRYCELPSPSKQLSARLEEYFATGDNFITFLDGLAPNLSKIMGKYWSPQSAATVLKDLL